MYRFAVLLFLAVCTALLLPNPDSDSDSITETRFGGQVIAIQELVEYPRTPQVKNLEAFTDSLLRVCGRLKLNPQWMVEVMDLESGLNPKAVNKISSTGASGLIQFTNTALRELNRVYGEHYTMQEVRGMDALAQLRLVEQYMSESIRRHGSPMNRCETYLHIFRPKTFRLVARLTEGNRHYDPASEFVLIASKGEAVYDDNAGLDINKDGRLTIRDIHLKFNRNYGEVRVFSRSFGKLSRSGRQGLSNILPK